MAMAHVSAAEFQTRSIDKNATVVNKFQKKVSKLEAFPWLTVN